MPRNPVQFAVVREDPAIELALARRAGVRRVLLIASGGCTALTLAAARPDLEITLLDPNPAQLDLVRRKIDLLASVRGRGLPRDHEAVRREFLIGADDSRALCGCGNFESLFRQLRLFLGELVCAPASWSAAFEDRAALARIRSEAMASPYWPVAFELFFADALLVAMFGRDAVQHAPRGSYPAYFRALFERGLDGAAALDNPFLHHILLGHYLDRPAALPGYLVAAVPEYRLAWRHCGIEDVDDWGEFDLVSLSNVFDWMSDAAIARVIERLTNRTQRGATVVVRQLNHQRALDPWLEPGFSLDQDLAARLLATDRSLFYSRLTIATRKES